jgi:L-lysine 2,3-aminomutase
VKAFSTDSEIKNKNSKIILRGVKIKTQKIILRGVNNN